MSALGQKQTSDCRPQKRTLLTTTWMSAFCQKRTHALQHKHKKKDRLAAVPEKRAAS
jgi:hypothetical protein